jgi:tetratricopeptide (TPR) repeat protein
MTKSSVPGPAGEVEKQVRSLLNKWRRFDEAKQFLEDHISAHPEDPSAHKIYSVLLARMGDGEGGIEQIEIALQLAPDELEMHSRRVDIYAGQERLDKLEDLYRTAVSDEPRRAAFRVALALICARTGRMDEAREHAQQAVNLAPEEPLALRALGEAQYEKAMALIRPDPSAAELMFQECVTTLENLASRFVSPHGEWHFYAARCMEQFAARSREINGLFRDGMDFMELRALSSAMKHYVLAGKQDAERLVDQELRRVEADLWTFGRPQQMAQVARDFRMKGELSLALEILTLSLQREPEQGVAYHELALTFEVTGDKQSAWRYSRRALEESPENREYQATFQRLDLH